MKDKYEPAEDKKLNEIYEKEEKLSTVPGLELLEAEANELYRNGKFAVAFQIYLNIFETDKTNLRTILQMVGCREKMGDFEGAEEICDLAFEIYPGEPHVYITSGKLNLRQNNLEAALEDFKTGKELGSEFCEEMFNRLKNEMGYNDGNVPTIA